MIEFVAETGSTNSDLSARLASGEVVAEGDWLVANRQRAGRGRLGRAWSDGEGNFMGSTVVRLRAGDPEPHSLALLAGLALRGAIEPVMPSGDLRLKWPNDIMVGTRKLAGILMERIADTVIVGVGVNLRNAPELTDRKAVALSEFCVGVDRDEFAADLARAFALELERWRAGGLPPVLRRWQDAAHPLGTALRVVPPGESPLDGRFAGLDDGGNLRLTLADSSQRIIHAGDVVLAEGN